MREIEKLYWSIGEVAKITMQPQSRIRFWCEAMDIKTKRNSHFNRMFTKEQLATIVKFSALSDTGEYTIKGIIKRLC